MDDRMRASDADRDRVTERLREHFAEGRLTQAELDERITAALNAKTLGDLRRLTSDLPEPGLISPGARPPQWLGPPILARRRGPRIFPVLLFVLLVALLVPHGGWVLLGAVNFLLLLWLFVMVVGGLMFSLVRRRMYRTWQSGYGGGAPRRPSWR
jgi:Domain of unknown function (DUF1707)